VHLDVAIVRALEAFVWFIALALHQHQLS